MRLLNKFCQTFGLCNFSRNTDLTDVWREKSNTVRHHELLMLTLCMKHNYRLYDLGLRQHTKASLLLELLTPTAFSVIIVIQLHFFHRPFMTMIDFRLPRRDMTSVTEEQRASLGLVSERADNDEEDSIRSSKKHWFFVWYNFITVLLWRLGELHMAKIVSFTMICVVISQVRLRCQATRRN